MAQRAHAPRSAGPGPNGRRHPEGPHPPPGRRPLQGVHAARDDGAGRQPRGDEGRCPGRRPGGRHPGREAHLRRHPAVPPGARRIGVGELRDRRRRHRDRVQVDTIDRTGVEMEALHACAVAALTIYDMCKSADRVDGRSARSPCGRRPAADQAPIAGPLPSTSDVSVKTSSDFRQIAWSQRAPVVEPVGPRGARRYLDETSDVLSFARPCHQPKCDHPPHRAAWSAVRSPRPKGRPGGGHSWFWSSWR